MVFDNVIKVHNMIMSFMLPVPCSLFMISSVKHNENTSSQHYQVKMVHFVFNSFTCQCGAFPGSDENKKELDDLVDAYQKGLQNLVDSGRYDTRDDFTVVDQPFFSETQIPVKVRMFTINKFYLFIEYFIL